MSRVRIDFPMLVQFSTALRVRVGDVNGANHLGHDRLISLLHEARAQYFQALSFDEQNIEGVGTIVADLAVEYKNEAFVGDELLIEITFSEPGRCGGGMYYRVCNAKTERLIALAKTGLVFFDYACRKPVSIPDSFLNKIGSMHA